MMQHKLTTIGCAFALTISCTSPALAKIDESKLIGAWRLVYSEMKLPDGRTFPAPTYGPNPHGYLIYDASHTMCVYLDVDKTGSAVPPELKAEQRTSPSTYCGRWYIEPSGEAVIHEPEVGGPNMAGSQALRRRAVLEGDMLTIRSPTPKGLLDYFIRFERVKDNPSAAR